MRTRIYRWFEDHPAAGDVLLMLAVLAVTLPLARTFTPTGYGDESLLLTLLLVVPLALRRTTPEWVFAAVTAAGLLQLAMTPVPLPADVVVPMVVYSTVAYGPGGRWNVALGITALFASVAGPVRWGYPEDGGAAIAVSTFLCLALVALAWVLGERRRSRDQRVEELRRHNRLLEVERDQRAAMAAAAERARIARELHDIVAHSLSVIIVQADGGAAIARTDPAKAKTVLDTVGETGREALAEMRRLLGVLRESNEPADEMMKPQPGVAGLPELVSQVIAAGLPTHLRIEGRPRPLAPGADLTLYRIAQEALTNVLRHAGPAASADLVLSYSDTDARLIVRDDGRGAAAIAVADGLGSGLQGMRERVAIQSGTLTAGPRVGGGYEVVAQLPLRGA